MRHRLAVALIAMALGTKAPAQQIDVIDWTHPDPAFGGVSGIEVMQGGTRFVAISDSGIFYRGAFERDDRGTITGVRDVQMQGIALENGATDGKKATRDTEALALSGAGDLFATLEGRHRVIALELETVRVRAAFPFGKDHAPLRNRGFEALAIDDAGALFALPEASPSLISPFPILRLGMDGAWQSYAVLPRTANFRPVGADFGPDGALYVLTRAFSGFAFTTKIERITLKDGQAPVVDTLLVSAPGQFDNLEGIAAWQDADGNIRLTMVSDDNFSRFQRTQIVELTLN